MTAIFDLIYVQGENGHTMSCAITDGDDCRMVGPFPAREAGPAIVDALVAQQSFGFADRKEAERAYMMVHFRNMSRRENSAGQSYPFKVTDI